MDSSGSYSNVRRGAMPSSSTTSAASSYKTNVNRTKTRKWVEAKVQTYDGDDWGNDYDDYDDEKDDSHDEPEVPSAWPSGPRHPATGPTNHPLPSSRTFSQPSAASLSSGDPRALGPSGFRTPSGPPSLHVQTQPTAAATPPYVTESAYPAAVSSHPNVAAGPYSAGPAPTPARFPPRKSSMGQHDRPEIDYRPPPRSDSRPGSSSGNRSGANERPTSPGRSSSPTATVPSFVRPSDIYKRIGEEKEKERLSMESGRPSMDSVLGRTEGTGSPTQFRSSVEQRRRTSFESNDGSDSARVRKPNLAPVAERKSEYGMEGILAKLPAEQPLTTREPVLFSHEHASPQREPGEEAKAELEKNRRLSTSPQLPTLTRMSDFGDDFFSNPSGYESKDKKNAAAVPIDSTRKQPSYAIEDAGLKDTIPTANGKENVTKERPMEPGRLDSTRPQLPGGWISESMTNPASSEQPTPLDQPEPQETRLATLQSTGDTQPIAGLASLPPSIDTAQDTSNANKANQSSAEESSSAARQHNDRIAPGALGTDEVLSTSKTATSPAQPLSKPTSLAIGVERLHMQASSTAHPAAANAAGPEFMPTAPLSPRPAQAGQPDFPLPQTHQRKSTISTIETASPEKESDKLREEIIKSLSPQPISPGIGGLPSSNAEPSPGDLTRESTYLAGVYDDYLSLSEEKSFPDVSQATGQTAIMAPSQPGEAKKGTSPERHDAPVARPAPLSPARISVSESSTKPRRFSWQHDPEEVTLSPVESRSSVTMVPPEFSPYSQEAINTATKLRSEAATPASDSLQPDTGAAGTTSLQVSQVSSRALEDPSTVPRVSSPATSAEPRRFTPPPVAPNTARISLAEEKVLIQDAQPSSSTASDQHPALTTAATAATPGDSPSTVLAASKPPLTQSTPAPTPFREILNLPTYEKRVQKFDEAREQFYIMDSGLSNWLIHIQSQAEHTSTMALGSTKPLAPKPGAPLPVPGAPGPSQAVSKVGTTAAHPRRASIGNMQQLMAGQSSTFGASGNQMGTKSKELLHAAGAFGNKGMKSGMKLFNKGKNKLRR